MKQPTHGVWRWIILLAVLYLTGCSDASFVENTSENRVGADKTADDPGAEDAVVPDENNPTNSDQPDADVDTTNVVDPVVLTVPEIKDKCLSGELATRTVRVSFPNPGQVCAWGQDGNLPMKNGIVTARSEAFQDLALDSTQVICGMEFSFQRQQIRYDDEISLLFNGRFLMHSVAQDIQYFRKKDDFYVYDWSRYVGKPYQANYAIISDYCIGADQGLGDCSMPPTETDGMIQLTFDDEVTYKLSAIAEQEQLAQFGWITTGDNDPASDCQHNDIEFDVTLRTVSR